MTPVKQQITPTESRQGSPRRMNLRVLVGSLVLALVAAAFLYGAFFANSTATIPSAQQQPQQPQPQ